MTSEKSSAHTKMIVWNEWEWSQCVRKVFFLFSLILMSAFFGWCVWRFWYVCCRVTLICNSYSGIFCGLRMKSTLGHFEWKKKHINSRTDQHHSEWIWIEFLFKTSSELSAVFLHKNERVKRQMSSHLTKLPVPTPNDLERKYALNTVECEKGQNCELI